MMGQSQIIEGVKAFELHFEDLGGPGGFKQRRDKFKFVFEE